MSIAPDVRIAVRTHVNRLEVIPIGGAQGALTRAIFGDDDDTVAIAQALRAGGGFRD